MSLQYVNPDSLQENVTKTKEHVESVRAALDLAKQTKMQFSTMPVPSENLLGMVVIYTGVTSANYTHNYCYECVSDGQDPATYSWVKTSVQDEVAVDGTTIQRDANTGELSAITATQNTKGIVKGGDGTSINAQGGVDVIDRLVVTDSLPTASEALVGKQRLYVGADTSNLTKGGIYECQSNGAATPTYSWVLISTAEVDLSLYKTIFVGTLAEWNALTTAQQNEYELFCPTDDSDYVGTVVDEVTDGELRAVTSNAVYDKITEINKDNGILGAKNLLPYPYVDTTKTANGITFTDNGDGSVAISGTHTISGFTDFRLCTNIIPLIGNATSVTISLGVDIELDSKAYIAILYSNNGEGITGIRKTFVLDITETMRTRGVDLRLRVKDNGTSVSNLLFKPMMRLSSDSDETWQPYVMTNRELTDAFKSLEPINIANGAAVDIETYLSSLDLDRDFTVSFSSNNNTGELVTLTGKKLFLIEHKHFDDTRKIERAYYWGDGKLVAVRVYNWWSSAWSNWTTP